MSEIITEFTTSIKFGLRNSLRAYLQETLQTHLGSSGGTIPDIPHFLTKNKALTVPPQLFYQLNIALAKDSVIKPGLPNKVELTVSAKGLSYFLLTSSDPPHDYSTISGLLSFFAYYPYFAVIFFLILHLTTNIFRKF